jgi:hypothetical protein
LRAAGIAKILPDLLLIQMAHARLSLKNVSSLSKGMRSVRS